MWLRTRGKIFSLLLVVLVVGGCQRYPQDVCSSDFDCQACETCQNGECRPKPGCVDPCADAHCDTPWTPVCRDADTQRRYSLPGHCAEGVCQYAFEDIACAGGCDEDLGRCAGECFPGERICAADLEGFAVCGPDPTDGLKNSFGPEVACPSGVTCQAGICQNQTCVEGRLLILLDRSTRMLLDGTFERVKPVLLAKLRERQSANLIGYRHFPEAGECSAGGLLAPAVNSIDTIENTLLNPTNLTTAPIGAALSDLEAVLGDPAEGQAVVLVTSQSETCQDLSATLQRAAALYRRGIRLFVVTVNPSADRTFLDQLAQAGGTGSANLAQTAEEIGSALEGIFTALSSCACAKGETRCQADQQLGCTADGYGFEPQHPCLLGCDGHTCRMCGEGQTRCAGDDLEICRADQLAYEFAHVCEPFGCAAELDRCFRHGDLKELIPEPEDLSFDSCPAIGRDGTLYLTASTFDADRVSTVVALDPSGQKKWEYPLGAGVRGAVALDSQDNLYVSTGDFKLTALNKEGRFRWSIAAGDQIRGPPAIAADDIVYLGSWDEYVYAFNPDGSRRWAFRAGSFVNNVIVRADGTLIATGNDVWAITPEGNLIWTYPVNGQSGVPAIGPDGSVYVFDWYADLVALTPEGKFAWKHDTSSYDTSIFSSPVVAPDGTIYAGSHNDPVLYALRPDGSERWQLPLTNRISSGMAVDRDGIAYVPVESDCLVAAVAPDMTILWTFENDSCTSTWEFPTIAPDGTLLLVFPGLWKVYNDSPLATGGWPKAFGDLKNSGRQP